jgi:bifunctional enzyme CysN/CysC
VNPSNHDNGSSMNIVFTGHVDHGKSTIVGRLLADTNSLPEGKLEQVRQYCERNSRPFEYAYLIDVLRTERSQGITLDSARIFFKSQKRNYIIIDAPGHIEFVKNMVTGASRAEAALIVIDVQEGIRENSRRHGYLLWMLGIPNMVVLINKMEMVNYDEDAYNAIRRDYEAFLNDIGIQTVACIPVSGREGDNIVTPSPQMPWYSGATVLEILDQFEKEKPPLEKPFRMPVQDVYKFTLFGDNRRIVAGRITSGAIRTGDEIVFYPSGKHSRVASLESFNSPTQTTAFSGKSSGITIADQLFIQRGEIAACAGEPPPRVASRLRASLFWLGEKPLIPDKEFVLKLGTARTLARISEIIKVIDSTGSNVTHTPDKIQLYDVAECILTLDNAIAFDRVNDLAETGRFVIVDDYEIRGGGIVLADLPDEKEWVRERVMLRNYKWEKSLITGEQRSERYNQRPTLILVTGQRNVGKKRIAKALEERLFSEGKTVYYLGIGNILYGVDADIKSKPPLETRHEHIRRMAEVTNILMDAGLIVVVTAVELTHDDLELITAALDTRSIVTLWVGEQVTTDIRYDLQVSGSNDDQVLALAQIKGLLQERGVIYKP